METVIEFLKKRFPNGIQMFHTNGWMGDTSCTIYDEHGITINYCGDQNYIEIFGLTEDEFTEVDSEVNKECLIVKEPNCTLGIM